MFYILFGALLIGVCVVVFVKRPPKKEIEVTFLEKIPRPGQGMQPVVRTYTQGPKLTKNDDAFYAVVQAAVAQTLAAEGINPEGGFVIRSIKPVRDAGQKPLSLKENEALYAVIMSAVAQTLSAEGINPEGGLPFVR